MTIADGVSLSIGNHVWSIGLNVILYIIIAAIVGVVAESIVGWRVPFGIIGAVIVGAIGAWLMTNVIIISGVGDINLWGVPVIRALIGSIILIAVWHLLTGGLNGRRRRRYRSA
ncbi:GlsB/YeaQ/YmgE family stress response membrane protein [Dictyobacter arantiisoli]|uniref:Transglycosylase n=1 Tax=Dictyobacter arantiisoli TaxID=2014874 RepID=A0A5A5TCF2_9CHLR|nr:GlsB/YeaQ/YmgE family stress response membrane protein [Dictyobacter arantiisoli]GCF08855.1 hypothetical protein KDI_24190 [Dictyobacter arantiisoli]